MSRCTECNLGGRTQVSGCKSHRIFFSINCQWHCFAMYILVTHIVRHLPVCAGHLPCHLCSIVRYQLTACPRLNQSYDVHLSTFAVRMYHSSRYSAIPQMAYIHHAAWLRTLEVRTRRGVYFHILSSMHHGTYAPHTTLAEC